MNYEVFSTITGLFTIAILISLVRKTKLHPLYLCWWICIICGILFLAISPKFIDKIGNFLGVSYPPIVICILGILVILIKLLSMDIYITQNEIRYKKLAQKMAVLEREIEELKKEKG